MSFTRRLLDGKPGCRLRAGTPVPCTSALACEAHTLALSVASHDSRYVHIALPLFPMTRELGRPDLPGYSARPLLRTSAKADDSESGGEGWSRTNKAHGAPGLQPGYLAGEGLSDLVGAGARAQPGLSATALPMKGSAPTFTQSTLLKSVSPGQQKSPGGYEPAGASAWSFPGRFDVRAFREIFLEGLT